MIVVGFGIGRTMKNLGITMEIRGFQQNQFVLAEDDFGVMFVDLGVVLEVFLGLKVVQNRFQKTS